MQATWEKASYDQKEFWYPSLTDEGKEVFKRGFWCRTIIVVTVPHAKGADKIVFAKTNRAKGYHDGRTPKKPLAPDEALAELTRLLGPVEGSAAFGTLGY